MEAAIDEQLSLGQLRRKIELAPDVPAATSKDRLRAHPVSLPFSCPFQNPLQVSSGTSVPAVLLGFAQGLAHQVLGQYGLLAMRFIAGGGGLKIETDCAIGGLALKLRQLTDIFAGHHFTLLGNTEMLAAEISLFPCFGAFCFESDSRSVAIAASVPG